MPGWAVELPYDTARDLGQRFLQDAIYFFTGDLLQVNHCDNHQRLVELVYFASECISNVFGILPTPAEKADIGASVLLAIIGPSEL